ncbi:MAG: PilZ domain-containing protein [Candidatus Omnitrophota bacterium]
MGAVNSRGNFRLRKFMDIHWSIPEQDIEGTGKVLNLSSTGIKFQTDKFFKPEHKMIILLSTPLIPSFPPKARLMWFNKSPKLGGYLCGVEFVKSLANGSGWYKWLEENTLKLSEATNSTILGQYLKSDYEE